MSWRQCKRCPGAAHFSAANDHHAARGFLALSERKRVEGGSRERSSRSARLSCPERAKRVEGSPASAAISSLAANASCFEIPVLAPSKPRDAGRPSRSHQQRANVATCRLAARCLPRRRSRGFVSCRCSRRSDRDFFARRVRRGARIGAAGTTTAFPLIALMTHACSTTHRKCAD